MQYQMIQQQGELQALCDQLASGPLAIDTEFVRTRTYFPQLGLMQLFDGRHLALIDPLAVEDMTPLWQRLQQPGQITVLHAGSEDLELILHEAGRMPAEVQDTQLAAALCGHGMSVGFNAMTQALLQVSLDKDQARTDWLARPLTDKQLEYAAADVFYLLPMYELLQQQLIELGRQDWFAEECQWLVQRKSRQTDPERAYLDVGNAWQLGAMELAVLRHLAAWREREARRRNLALNFVVKELHLFQVAHRLPRSLPDLQSLGLLPSEIRTHGKTLLRLVEEALQTQPDSWPAPIRRLVDHPHYKGELKRLRSQVETAANGLGLPVELIASRKMLNQYLTWLWYLDDKQKETAGMPRILTGWRKEILGPLVV